MRSSEIQDAGLAVGNLVAVFILKNHFVAGQHAANRSAAQILAIFNPAARNRAHVLSAQIAGDDSTEGLLGFFCNLR